MSTSPANTSIPLRASASELPWETLRVNGERIFLRPVEVADADTHFECFTDEITRYMVPATPSSVNDCLPCIESSRASMAAGA